MSLFDVTAHYPAESDRQWITTKIVASLMSRLTAFRRNLEEETAAPAVRDRGEAGYLKDIDIEVAF